MQSRRNADACVFRKRRESAARGAGKTLRGTDLRQGNGPVRGPADIRKNSPGNKDVYKRQAIDGLQSYPYRLFAPAIAISVVILSLSLIHI